MGISIEQYRARIGTFAARKCSRSEETRPVVFDQNTENSETLQPVLCSISWKTASLGILLVILSALCHSQLLIIGGVESHPGPESVDDVLAALCVGAPDTSIRDCIRLYRKEATTVQHKKAFAKCDKSTLVETMEYLNVSGQDEYTKESVINKLIVRIQNLLPDTCRMCKAEYCTKLKEVTILSCSLCGQAAHNECIAQKMGMDREQLEDLRKEEAQIRINPLEIPGCHYLCGPCEESVIPSTEAGKLKRRKNTLTTDSQSDIVFQETQEGTDHVGQSQETNDESNPTASQIDSTESSSHHEDGLSTVDPPTNQLPTRGEPGGNSRTQAPEQLQNKSQGICSFFWKGTCRYGISGRGCPKQHPKACRKLILHGTRGPRGCNKGNACENFHPKMCRQSLAAGECLTLDCKLRHVAGTRRTTTSGRGQPQDHTDTRSRIQNHGRSQHHDNWFQQQDQQTPQQTQPPNSATQADFLEMLNVMRTEIMTAMETKMSHLSQQISAACQVSANQANTANAWHTVMMNQAPGPWQQMTQQQVPTLLNAGQRMYIQP